jgi:hypothetical protein
MYNKSLFFIILVLLSIIFFSQAQSQAPAGSICDQCKISNETPVCGDGITYSSECVAKCAKAVKISPGKCRCNQ